MGVGIGVGTGMRIEVGSRNIFLDGEVAPDMARDLDMGEARL